MSRFIDTIWDYYHTHRRDMPWRTDTRPYYIVVSEIMLQQTQVHRVVKKFESFVKRFPDWQSLAHASTRDVLQEWSGLGYNRRALYLKKISEMVTRDKRYTFLSSAQTTHVSHNDPSQSISNKKSMRTEEIYLQRNFRDRGGIHAWSGAKLYETLHTLPGIGPNTAGSILAFAFNIPHPFIETNVRSAFIHFFFPEIEKRESKKAMSRHGGTDKKISDDQLTPLIEKALMHPRNKKNPREWYYALMDYGSYLKQTLPNPSRRSIHHAKQSPFKGSNRELRSRILKIIMQKPQSLEDIGTYFNKEKISVEKILKNLDTMAKEGFVNIKGSLYSIR